MSDLIIFPEPLTATTTLRHDMGWTVMGVSAVHPSGRPGQSFAIPPGTINSYGAQITLTAPGYQSVTQRGILYLNDGHLEHPWTPGQTASFDVDDFRLVQVAASGTDPVRIVDDHFEQNGRRWFVKGTDGFCDYARFLDGENLRPLLEQSRDLGCNLRRIFGNMQNIRVFDARRYGQTFYARLPEFFALYAEYGLFGEFDVLPDTGYQGWSLSQCQAHWAQVCDALRPVSNRLISLTNEFDHGGNLVGTVNDYPRPDIELVSQGSANSDAPPPRPGWGFREFHCLKEWPKIFLFEDQLFNREGVDSDGSTWGPKKPTYLSECYRFSETNPYTDERLARTLAYESLAFGSGMVLHNDEGKYSRLMTPRIASCCKTAMDVLSGAI